MRILAKKLLKAPQSRGLRLRTPVNLQRLGAPLLDPELQLPPILAALCVSSRLYLTRLTAIEKTDVTTAAILLL